MPTCTEPRGPVPLPRSVFGRHDVLTHFPKDRKLLSASEECSASLVSLPTLRRSTGIPTSRLKVKKPNLIKQGTERFCNTDNYVPIAPGLSADGRSSSTSAPVKIPSLKSVKPVARSARMVRGFHLKFSGRQKLHPLEVKQPVFQNFVVQFLWAIEKPKLDNAQKLGGIYYIGPDDMDFKDTMKDAGKKLDMPLESAGPC